MADKRDALVKISGDLLQNKEVFEELSRLSKTYNVFIICGGGTAVSKKLKEKGIPFSFKNGSRIIRSYTGRELACKVLEEQAVGLRNELSLRKITATVWAPLLEYKSKIFRINADDYFIALSPNFITHVCFTKKGRDKSRLRGCIEKLRVVEL